MLINSLVRLNDSEKTSFQIIDTIELKVNRPTMGHVILKVVPHSHKLLLFENMDNLFYSTITFCNSLKRMGNFINN